MDTCFLFTKHLDENGCFSLKINQSGALSAPAVQRNFSDIKTLQEDCKTLVIESAECASILNLELPWLPERKSRVAIPYALEDKLAQPVEELHFAFDKLRYHNGCYTVAVISKQRIKFIMSLLADHDINFEAITLDWFALSPQQLCICGPTLLVNNDDFKGAVTGELALKYLKNHPLNQPLVFQDSEINVAPELLKNEAHSYTWIAQNIQNSKPLNLCQGDMQHGNAADRIMKGYLVAGILCCIWLLSLLLTNAITLHSLNKKTQAVDEQINVIYHQFFPDAKQVISPKFRISQLLGNNASDSQTHFWFLLNQFAKAVKDKTFTIEQLRFQNKALSVTLVSSDFANLEKLENELKNLQLKVKQTQASTRDEQVVATLELM